MGLLATALVWLIDRVTYRHDPVPVMSSEDLEVLLKDTCEEAEIINSSILNLNPVRARGSSFNSELSELSDALNVAAAAKPEDSQRRQDVDRAKLLFMPAVQELVRLGEADPKDVVRLDSVGSLSKTVRFKAAELLDGPFGERLRHAQVAGVAWEDILSPNRPSTFVGETLTRLSKKAIRKLPRPRPKSQNPRYVDGFHMKTRDVFTLDHDERSITAHLKFLSLGAAREALSVLELAKKERENLHKYYTEAIQKSDLKIAAIESDVASRQAQTVTLDPSTSTLCEDVGCPCRLPKRGLPKRDEKGRFIKG